MLKNSAALAACAAASSRCRTRPAAFAVRRDGARGISERRRPSQPPAISSENSAGAAM
jgi:hypothetical protein